MAASTAGCERYRFLSADAIPHNRILHRRRSCSGPGTCRKPIRPFPRPVARQFAGSLPPKKKKKKKLPGGPTLFPWLYFTFFATVVFAHGNECPRISRYLAHEQTKNQNSILIELMSHRKKEIFLKILFVYYLFAYMIALYLIFLQDLKVILSDSQYYNFYD